MDKEVLLKLDEKSENLKIISNYLANCHFFDESYYLLYLKKIRILTNCKRYNEALEDSYMLVSYLNELDEDIAIMLLSQILELDYLVNRFDEYNKYLEIKTKRIKTSEAYKIIYDKFKYYYGLKDYDEAILLARDYLSRDLTKEERIKINLELLDICLEISNKELFNEVCESLKKTLKDSLDLELEKNIEIKILKIKYNLHYDDTFDYGKNILDKYELSNNELILIATILLKIKTNNNELNKAVIIDSEYQELLNDVDIELALDFVKEAKILYEKLNHKVTIEYYENLNNELVLKLEKKKKKQKNKSYIIPDVVIKEKKNNNADFQDIVYEIKNKEIIVSKSINKALDFINDINNNTKFREIFRQFGIKFNKEFGFKEANILYNNNLYYFHTFKNGRVFDRTYDTLPESLQSSLYIEEKEIFALNVENKFDLFTNKEFIYSYAYKFNLYFDNNYSGCLILYNDIEIESFDEILIFIKILNYLLNNEINKFNMEKDNSLRNYIFELPYFGFKNICHDRVYLSKGLKQLYNKDYHSNEEMFLDLDNKKVIEYKEIINNIKNNISKSNYIVYKLNNHYYKEIFYPYVYLDEFSIISLVILYDDEVNLTKELTNDAYMNETNNIYNYNKFKKNIVDSEDLTIVLFAASNMNNYIEIYGYDFYLDFLNKLAVVLKNYFYQNFKMYYYNLREDIFAFTLETKADRRIINSLVKNFINYLEVSFENFKFGFSPEFYSGIYRVSDYKKSPIDDVLKYAYFALEDAKIKNQKCLFFDKDSYKANLEDKMIYKEISDAINNNKLSIIYDQVADIKNLEVYGYYANLNLKTELYDTDKISTIIKKRNLESKIDKHKIMRILSNLKNFYQEINGLFYVFLSVDSQTIDSQFINFFEQNLKFFKIPHSFIYLIVDNYEEELSILKDKGMNIITKNIFDVLNNKTTFLALDYKLLKIDSIDDLIILLENHSAELFLYNVDSNLKDLATTNVKYVTGQIYKKKYLITDIINNVKNSE